jgi:hypothetical protein
MDAGSDPHQVAAEKLDFSYDAKIDQVAFMSCPHYATDQLPNSNDLNRPYFTFRAGAYRTGGLKLKENFFSELGMRPADSQAEILSLSPKNTRTVLQLGVRNRQDKQQLYRNGDLTKGQDYFNVFAELGTEDVSKTLVNTPVGWSLRHIRNGKPGGLRFEGDLSFTSIYNFPAGNADPGGVVRVLSSDMLLALTYTQSDAAGLDYLARSPAQFNGGTDTDAKTNVYGIGYELSFTQPAGVNASYPTAVLNGVREVPLSTAGITNPSTWDCPANLRLRIVRPADAIPGGVANCTKKPDPPVLDSRFQAIRNSLRTEDWYVNLDVPNPCIVSKKAESCYKPTDTVAYPPQDACQTNGGATCVAYVSICQRR